jgi:hypothetical protein
MNMSNTQTLHGLYGSQINRSKAVGYCYYHKAALTVKTMKCHECLKKQCDALKKYEEHDYWRQRAQKKAMKNASKLMN